MRTESEYRDDSRLLLNGRDWYAECDSPRGIYCNIVAFVHPRRGHGIEVIESHECGWPVRVASRKNFFEAHPNASIGYMALSR